MGQTIEGTKNTLKTGKSGLPRDAHAAVGIIEQFESGAQGLRGDEDVSDNVAQYMLTDRTNLLDEKWLGTEE